MEGRFLIVFSLAVACCRAIEFNPTLVEIRPDVHVAIGYAGGNVIFVQGEDGVLAVDGTENRQAAKTIFTDYQKITPKPLKGIVLTHFHTDHYVGISTLLEMAAAAGSGPVEVFVHSSSAFVKRKSDLTSRGKNARTGRQFGFSLPPELSETTLFKYDPEGTLYNVQPTQVYDTRANFTVAGIEFQLIHTPGETDDHTTVWIPSMKIAMSGDNVYMAFPNIYTIRGSEARDAVQWFQSIDLVRGLGAEILIPQHTLPVVGVAEVETVLSNFRDGIQFVHDQTLRNINKGYSVDKIVANVQLPPTLAASPYMNQSYGRVDWSVRRIYTTYLGWFDGDAAKLQPLPEMEAARRWKDFMGKSFLSNSLGQNWPWPLGHYLFEKFLANLQDSVKTSYQHFDATGEHLFEELQWALEGTTMALKWTDVSDDYIQRVKETQYEALFGLAEATQNSNAKNYYLSSALELSGNISFAIDPNAMLGINMYSTLDTLMQRMTLRLNAESCDDTQVIDMLVILSDAPKWYRFILRNCVFEYTNGEKSLGMPEESGLKMTTTSHYWRLIVTNQLSPQDALALGAVSVDGSEADYLAWFNVVDPELYTAYVFY